MLGHRRRQLQRIALAAPDDAVRAKKQRRDMEYLHTLTGWLAAAGGRALVCQNQLEASRLR